MNPQEFYSLRINCVKCDTPLVQSVQLSVGGFPFQYTLCDEALTRDYGSSDIIFEGQDKPPTSMNMKYGYLARNDSKEPLRFDRVPPGSNLILRATCKDCGQFSIHSSALSLEVAVAPFEFTLSHERFVSLGSYILVCNPSHGHTYITVSLNPVRRFTLDYKPIDEWIVSGDDMLVKDKLTKLKLLL